MTFIEFLSSHPAETAWAVPSIAFGAAIWMIMTWTPRYPARFSTILSLLHTLPGAYLALFTFVLEATIADTASPQLPPVEELGQLFAVAALLLPMTLPIILLACFDLYIRHSRRIGAFGDRS